MQNKNMGIPGGGEQNTFDIIYRLFDNSDISNVGYSNISKRPVRYPTLECSCTSIRARIESAY